MLYCTPFLLFDGNCAEAMKFYQSCFGGELTLTKTGDTPMKDMFPPAKHNKIINAHLKGVFFLTQKCLSMINDNGSIVNFSSGTTRFANPGYIIYAAMKGAIEVFTKYLAKEVGPRGITANVVAPGGIETDFNNGIIRNNPQVKERIASITPLGRTGKAEDIGGVVAFLCSEDAHWISGQRIEVSGGINL